jgi:hypothetical protein
MRKYLEKHLKRYLTKEEREALFKEHPKPDLDATDFIGKHFPKERDTEFSKIQAATLASVPGTTIPGSSSRPPSTRACQPEVSGRMHKSSAPSV